MGELLHFSQDEDLHNDFSSTSLFALFHNWNINLLCTIRQPSWRLRRACQGVGFNRKRWFKSVLHAFFNCICGRLLHVWNYLTLFSLGLNRPQSLKGIEINWLSAEDRRSEGSLAYGQQSYRPWVYLTLLPQCYISQWACPVPPLLLWEASSALPPYLNN